MRQIKRSRGVTLIEAVAAIITLSIAVPPLILLFTQVADRDVDVTFQQVGVFHAESLLEEIVSKAFEDPDLSTGSFGTEEGSRVDYDDIDDFDGLIESPPERQNGTVLDAYGGFTRTATVQNVTAADPDPTTAETDGSTEFKRIQVTVTWTGGKGGELTLSTLRTQLIDPGGAGPPADPLDEVASAATASQSDNREFTIDLVSISGSDAEIASFELSAVQSMPTLDRFFLDGQRIYDGGVMLPTGERNLNDGSASDRTVSAGASPELLFEFDDDISSGTKDFTLVLHFTDSTSSTITFSVTW